MRSLLPGKILQTSAAAVQNKEDFFISLFSVYKIILLFCSFSKPQVHPNNITFDFIPHKEYSLFPL